MPSRAAEQAPVDIAPVPEIQGPVERTPEELFADHIALVKEQGDAFDVREDLRPWGLGKLALCGTLIYPIIAEARQAPILTGLAAVSALTLAYLRHTSQADANRGEAYERYQPTTQVKIDTSYDVYRTKESLALHYKGTHRETGDRPAAAEHLSKFARLAQDNNVGEIIICTKYLNEQLPSLALPGATTTAAAWLKANKSIHISGASEKQEWQIATPAEWLEALRKLNLEESAHNIASLVNLLPDDHYLRRLYKDCSGSQELLLRLKINRHLKDTFGFELQETRRDVISRTKQALMPSFAGNRVTYTINGKYDSSVDLEAAFGFRPGQVQELIALNGSDRRTIRAIELSIYKLTNAIDHVVPNAEHGQEPQPPAQSAYLSPQQAVCLLGWRPPKYRAEYKLMPQRCKQLTAIMGALMLACGLSAVSIVADRSYKNAQDEAKRQIAVENNLDPNDADIDGQVITDRVDSWHPINGVWHRWMDAREWVGDIDFFPNNNLGGGNKAGGGEENKTATYSVVGNVREAPDRAVWKITPHNMDPTGYWAEATSNRLIVLTENNSAKPIDGVQLQWETSNFLDPNNTTVPLLRPSSNMAEGSSPVEYMIVERAIRPQDVIATSKGKFIQIPIKSGTMIASGSVNGQAVSVLRLNNGTGAIELPKNSPTITGNLKYVLIPNDQLIPHAVTPVMVGGNVTFGNKEIDRLWEYAMPGFSSLSPDQKRSAAIKYLQRNFEYSTQPFSKKDLKSLKSLEDFVDLTLDKKRANCNVAGTLLELIDPRLNVATGFMNKPGKGQNQLSTKERHQWSVDDKGKIYDATPGQISPVTNSGKDNPAPLEPWLGWGIVLSGAAAAAAKRRRIASGAAKGVSAVAAQMAQKGAKKFEEIDEATLNLTLAAAEQALYGRNFSLAAVATRASKSTADADATRAKLIDRPDIHGKRAEQLLRRYEAPKPVIRTTRQARRLARYKSMSRR